MNFFKGKNGPKMSRVELIALGERALIEAQIKGIQIKVIPTGVSGGDNVFFRSSLSGKTKRSQKMRHKGNAKGNRSAVLAHRAKRVAIKLASISQ